MASYIILFSYTDQGIKNIKESYSRINAARQTFRALGAEVKAFYSVLGRYDTVFIVEAPDDETVARAVLSVGSLGNVHSETIRAFSEDEFRKIVAGLR